MPGKETDPDDPKLVHRETIVLIVIGVLLFIWIKGCGLG